MLNAAALSDADVDLMAQAQAQLIPAFVTGVVPIFTLPAAVTSLYATIAANPDAAAANPVRAALLPLYPLVLDLETAARIFLGNLTSWLDADLVALNPQLPGWWSAAGNVSRTLKVLVGASNDADPVSGAQLLFQALLQSNTAALPANAYVLAAIQATVLNSVGDRVTGNLAK